MLRNHDRTPYAKCGICVHIYNHVVKPNASNRHQQDIAKDVENTYVQICSCHCMS